MNRKYGICNLLARKLSKRQFLSTVCATAAGVGLAPEPLFAQEAEQDKESQHSWAFLEETLRWLERLELRDNRAVEDKARLLLLDTLVCATAGFAESELRSLGTEFANIEPGAIQLPGLNRHLSVSKAAFIATMAACWHEACAGLARAHGRPGLHAVPAAVCFGLGRGATIGDVLTAVVRGYEVGARFGEKLRIRAGMHVDGTWGAFASTAAVSSLLGWDISKTKHALAIAACQIPTSLYLPVATGRTARNTYAAHGVSLGISSAQSAQAGLTGPDSAFAHAQKLVFSGDAEASSPEAGSDEFLILEGYLKPFAAARHVHYPSTCAIEWRDDVDNIDPGRIEALELETYQEAVTYCGNRAPETPIQAQFSLSYGTAFALRTGDLGPEAYRREHLSDTVQRRLESLIRLRVDPQMKQRGARLRVTFGGETRQYEVSSILGDPDQPMDKQAVVGKAEKYGRPLLGDDSTGALIDHILQDPLDTVLDFS